MQGWVRWLGLVALMLSVPAQAQPCVEVTGQASIQNGDVAYARQMAIRDALAQAVLSRDVMVSAQAETRNFSLSRQTAQFAAQQQVTSMQVLHEEQQAGQIEVQVKACLSEGGKVCPNYIARYQPKIAIASVAVQDVYSAKDIMDLSPGYQGELFNRLWAAGQRNAELVHTAADLYPGSPITPNLSPALLTPIRDKTLAQFLVLTVVRSLDWEADQWRINKNVREYFGYTKDPNKRQVDVDWFLVDLNAPRILAQGNAYRGVEGEVRVGRDKPFATRPFFLTPTGQAFDYVLGAQVQSVMETLACVPLEATIAEVDKDKVIVPVAIDAGVQVGDVLAVYSRTSRAYRIGTVELGTELEPTAFIRVQKVLPRFLVGVFEGKQGRVEAGDLVKSW